MFAAGPPFTVIAPRSAMSAPVAITPVAPVTVTLSRARASPTTTWLSVDEIPTSLGDPPLPVANAEITFTRPLPVTSMSSPAVRLVAVMPLVPPESETSRPAFAVPIRMLLFDSPLLFTTMSTAATMAPRSTVRAPTKTLSRILPSVSISASVPAMTLSVLPASASPPITDPPAMIVVVPPEVRRVNAALPVPVAEIALPAVTVPSVALDPKPNVASVAALTVAAVTASALIVTDPSVAVAVLMLASVPPLTIIAPRSATSAPLDIAPVAALNVRLSRA